MRNYGLLRLALRLAGASLTNRARRQDVAARLASLPRQGLPVAAPVEIRWDDHLVPFVGALYPERAGDLGRHLFAVEFERRRGRPGLPRQSMPASPNATSITATTAPAGSGYGCRKSR